jgi:hypothetical protein
MPDTLLSRWRGIRNRRRKRAAVHRKALARLNASVAKLNLTIRRRQDRLAGGPGEKAARYLLGYAGRTEQPAGSNDAPFLAAWRKGLPSLSWMRGQPWCGFACRAAYHYAAGKELPDGVVYTPNIVQWARTGQGFTAVPATAARAGDLVVFNFPGGSSVADHVGLALGPAVGGLIPTVEGNTSSSDAGSQSNGGGVFKRSRPVGLIAVVARPI